MIFCLLVKVIHHCDVKSCPVFLDLSADIDLPIKQEKTVLPTTAITFLGLELDSEKLEIRLPEDKLVKLKDKLAYIANMKKVTLGEL